MTNLQELTASQLRQIIAIKERIETLQAEIDAVAGGGEVLSPATEEASAPAKRKYHMTAAHKRNLIKVLARARKIRWAKARASGSSPVPKKRRMSKAGRAAIAAAQKARWAKVRGSKAPPKPTKKDRRSSPATKAKLAAAAKARWARVKAEGKTRL